uniref:Uncharacterized protein n=1 Tax=Meloidogyne hapla TaxID=6305 RepID=A0A1I8BDF6_MELHA
MSAFPSDINLNRNNLFNINKEDKKEDFIKETENINFIQIYNKFWPFRIFKITNFGFFLTILFILYGAHSFSYSLLLSLINCHNREKIKFPILIKINIEVIQKDVKEINDEKYKIKGEKEIIKEK